MNDLELDRKSEWLKSLAMLQGLFPKWHVTNEQLETWRMEFGMMNPVWFRESLQLVYSKYSSDHPKPKRVHQAFKEVKAGHTGIPVGGDYLQEGKRQQEDAEKEEYDQQVNSDRRNARQQIASWSEEERIKYATLVTNHYKFANQTRMNPKVYGEWSDTFTQMVYIFRKMKSANKK